jgi:hypothetical protein
MSNFKLKEALKRRNELNKDFMSQQEFAVRLFENHNPKTALYHVSMASNGHAFGRFTPDKILKTCEILECEPNFLFNYQTKTDNNDITKK